MTMNKKSNEHFINTFADGNYEVATPPFFKDEDNKRLVFDALDVGIHENIFTEGELDAAHGVMMGAATLENDGITAVARALQRHSELFPNSNADELLADFRVYVRRNRHEFFPGG